MFWIRSSLKRRNMHFVSSSADGPEGHPIGLVEKWPLQFGLNERCQRRDREAVGKPVARVGAHAERAEFVERVAEQPRRGAGLLHAQPQIRGRDQNTGAE